MRELVQADFPVSGVLRCAHIDETLVGRTAEHQPQILLFFFKRAVDQNIDAVQQLVGCVAMISASGQQIVL